MHDARAKNAYMKAERASAELRRGGHVMLRLNNGEAALFCGAEFADCEDINFLSRLAGSGPLLVMTANRVKAFNAHFVKAGQQRLSRLPPAIMNKCLTLLLAKPIWMMMMV